MHFKLEHAFEAPAEAVVAALADPAFPDYLRKHMKQMQSIESLERKDHQGGVDWRMRCVPVPMIKSVGPKKVPPEALAFMQEMHLDRPGKRAAFKNVAEHARVRAHLESSGTIEFRDDGPRTKRTLSGELKIVGLPFLLRPLAGIAEQIIYSNAQKLLEEEAQILQAFVRERQAAAAAAPKA